MISTSSEVVARAAAWVTVIDSVVEVPSRGERRACMRARASPRSWRRIRELNVDIIVFVV